MTQNEIDSYLLASRQYIDNAKRRIAQMGFCCPTVFLGGLIDRQNQLERMAWSERQRDSSMGLAPLIWLVSGMTTVASALGAWVYSHYSQVKIQSDYLDCLKKYEPEHGAEQAAKICSGSSHEGVKESITNTIKLAIYGAIAVMALNLASKYLGKRIKN